MDYSETMAYMYDKLPMFHRIGKAAYKANLNNALYLDGHYGKPHRKYATIHVAGTNGKGSVSHSLSAILQKAGYRTGLFTSPHLKDFRERIRVNGEMITEWAVTNFVSNGIHHFEAIHPSFFEMTSALAFQYFADENVDIAIIEVGMGGRLDSTNIITPILSVITNIGLDHTEFLGDSLEKIAIEKAGIIKKNVPVVIGEFHSETWPVFESFAKNNNASIQLASSIYQVLKTGISNYEKQFFIINNNQTGQNIRIDSDLLGQYQQRNVCTILAAIDNIIKLGYRITSTNIQEALSNVTGLTGLKGRWQVLGKNPLVICDTGHNLHGIEWVVRQIKVVKCKKLHMVIGFVKDKDISGVLKLFPIDAIYYFTQASSPRALEARELYFMASAEGLKGNYFLNVLDAFQSAKEACSSEDFIFIGGSNFVVAEIL